MVNQECRAVRGTRPDGMGLHWAPTYGTAVRLDRLKLLMLPLVALLIPLVRIAPPLYQWRVRSRIYRWYAEVRDIDMTLLSETPVDAQAIAERLRTLEREVASVSVPLAYAGEQYHLRLHIRFLQERLAAARRQGTAVLPARLRGPDVVDPADAHRAGT